MWLLLNSISPTLTGAILVNMDRVDRIDPLGIQGSALHFPEYSLKVQESFDNIVVQLAYQPVKPAAPVYVDQSR